MSAIRMNIKRFSLPLSVYGGRTVPKYGIIERYCAIIEACILSVLIPIKSLFISTNKRQFEKNKWKVFPFQINTVKISEIKRISHCSCTQIALNLICTLESIKNFDVSTKLFKRKSMGVIKKLRTFVRITLSVVRKPVKVNQTIQTVLAVFSSAPSEIFKIHCPVNTSTMILGSEFKLRTINSLEEKNKVHWNIYNIGGLIPKNIREVMFVKFFFPELNKSRIGLGLSIVKSIFEDLKASIVIGSETVPTTLTLTFNTIVTDGKN